jgi:hypothetical protein
MRNIEEIAQIASNAIRANWGYRNIRICNVAARNAKMVAQRKRELREWVAVLRIVRDPLNHDHVKRAAILDGDVRVGALMAHDLRRRVTTAGWSARCERIDRMQARCEELLG